MAATDRLFAGSIPEVYDRFLVPLIFEPYALDQGTNPNIECVGKPYDLRITASGQ
jgi:hypothetical protein